MRKKLLCLLLPIIYYTVAIGQTGKIDSLLKELGKAKDDSNKVKLYRKIGNSVAYQDPRKAIGYWLQGAGLAKKIGYKAGAGNCYQNISTGYSFLAKLDSSLIYMDTAYIYIREAGDTDDLALFFLNRADSHTGLGNFKDALKDCDAATVYAEKLEGKDRLARIYSVRSSIYTQQKNYDAALIYLDKAFQLYERMHNVQMMAKVFSDKADVYRHTNREDAAVVYYKKAIVLGDSVQDLTNLSSYYSSLSEVYVNKNRLAEAEPLALKAMKYAKEMGSPVQEALTHSLLSKLYVGQKRFKEAINEGLTGYDMSMKEMYLPLQQESADILAEAFSKSGNYNEAYKYMRISKELNDSLTAKNFSEESASLQTNFDVAQKEKQIELLSKDAIIKEQKLKRQQNLVIGSLVIAVLALIGLWLAVNRYRLRQKMKELELRNRIAADLHDEVGSSLSSIHMLSQMATKDINETAHKDILARMSNNAKETMDKMGDIVWMIKPNETEAGSLKQRMERFAYEICSSKNISASLQLDELERIKLTMEQRKNVYLVFKEAMNNAVKYSGTEKIEVTASLQNKELILQVKDFGKGFDSSIVKKGNGLDNMQHRANESGGILRTETSINTGTTIQLIVPV
jgi:two-component system, NarL family, sensor histidine kinase UhpB